jgi:hypothetical protein
MIGSAFKALGRRIKDTARGGLTFVRKYGAVTALNVAVVAATLLMSATPVLAQPTAQGGGLTWGAIYEQAKILGGILAALGLVGLALRRLGGPLAEAVPFLAQDNFIISAFIGALILLNVTKIVTFMGLPAPGS